MTDDAEVYPKAPLVEVVFEVRFPGEPALECHRDELFEFVRAKLPVVRVPELAAQDNFKFRVYQFASDDNAYTVMAGLNLLGYSSKRYSGYADFKEQLAPIFEFCFKRFRIEKLHRVGFRYINAIPFTREEGAIPLSRFLKSRFSLAPQISEKLGLCSIGFVQDWGQGQILTRIETIKTPDGKEEALLLDFDCFQTEGLSSTRVAGYLEENHSLAKGFFESIITDQYREFLRGKPLL